MATILQRLPGAGEHQVAREAAARLRLWDADLTQATYDRNRAADTWLFVAAGVVEIAMLVAVLMI